MATLPGATAVTTPVAESTVAIAGFDDDQRTGRPVSAAPAESRTVAVAVALSPMSRGFAEKNTETEATRASTVSVKLPLRPSLVAVMTVVPGATAVMRPVAASIDATVGVPLLQVTARVSTLSAASRTVATAVSVSPGKSELSLTEAATLATGTGVTVTVAWPVRPSAVAVIVAVPGATAVTRPLPLTLATPPSLVLQLADGVVAQLLAVTVAASWLVAPTVTLAVGGVTFTALTVHSGAAGSLPQAARSASAPSERRSDADAERAAQAGGRESERDT
jgi:hypothetical protein